MTRRDRCHFVAARACGLTDKQRQVAWSNLCLEVETLAEMDIPKFKDLLRAIRRATIAGKQAGTIDAHT